MEYWRMLDITKEVLAMDSSSITSLQRFISQYASTTRALYLLALSAIVCSLLSRVLRPRRFGNFPIIGKCSDIHGALKEGTEKYPTSAFALATAPPLVILPVELIDDIKSLPETSVSMARELYRRTAGKYSKLGTNSIAAIQALKIDLNRDANLISTVQEETVYSISKTIGTCNDWTPMPAYQTLNRIIALISGRVFVGIPLSRTEEWIHISIDWANDVAALMTRTAGYPVWLRPFITPYWAETKRVLEHRARAKIVLGPMLTAQMQAKDVGALSQCAEAKPPTLATWILKYVSDRHANLESLVRHQLGITWASIHTSTGALTHTLFDLAARPEYQQPLRDELEAVLRESDGRLEKAELAKLHKMDSFMKESQRLNPASFVTPLRVTVTHLELSTGETIPPGTSIGFFSVGINESATLHAAPPSDVFDGFRFSRMREKAGEENRHRFGSTGLHETLDFGHGIHACPGRHFAAAEIKIVLVHLLRNYDMRLRDGEGRPSNKIDEIWIVPDQKAEVLFRSRSSASE